ncbi:MAG: hypothetical protein HC808_18065 [Candidatus Competibacteraceae bacterium]|nr:hypothetical protein [Candidatus Competibacteraceae bacterium]
MKRISASIPLLALLLCWATNDTFAQYFCAKDKYWSCFGFMEVSFAANGEEGRIRIIVFANGDLMAEANEGTSVEAKLLALKSGRRLFKGVPDEEIKNGFPFIFFDYGFAYPVQALQSIYPAGIESVPERQTKTSVVLEGQYASTLVARRVSGDKVWYKLVMPMMTMNGFIERAKKPPLPDSYKLVQWKDENLRMYATLAEARAATD